jgi:SAM-dependent methyltransferase
MDKNAIETRVRELGQRQSWFHEIELPCGVRTVQHEPDKITDNYNVIKWDKIKDCLLVEGKTVLDIGCNEGFYSCKLSELGASRVLGIEVDEMRYEKASFVMEMLNLANVTIKKMNLYDLKENLNEKFDYALCLGMLHRLPDPHTALEIIAEVADTVLLEWCAWNVSVPAMRFWGGPYKEDLYNTGYWLMSRNCLKDILRRHDVHYFVDVEPYSLRAIMVATKDQDVYKTLSGIRIKHSGIKKMRYKLDWMVVTVKSLLYFLKPFLRRSLKVKR